MRTGRAFPWTTVPGYGYSKAVTFTKVLQDGRTATVTPSGRQRCTVEIGGAYFTDGEIRELPSPRGPQEKKTSVRICSCDGKTTGHPA